MSAARRLDIQGLRAIAVLLVVLYHAEVPLLTGGFIGVDVFYAISGFLIVGLIADEVSESGRLRLGTFWLRRIRRLLPASFLVLLVTVIASKLLLPPLMMTAVARDAAATALYVSNINFAFTGIDYLSSEEPSPLLHYWSLAVEEQFYLLLPILAFVVARFSRRPVRTLTVLLALGVLVSFLLCLVLTPRAVPFAFFMLPSRAWELGLGGLAALAVRHYAGRTHGRHTGGARGAVWAMPAALIGLAAIVWTGLTYDDTTLFPSWRAAIPVLGTVLLLVAGSFADGPLQRTLSVRPLTYIGDISYSLYLWHWPVLIIPALAMGETLPAATRVVLVLLSVVLASATYHLLEDPIRRSRRLAHRPRRTFTLAVTATAGALVLSAWSAQLPRLDAGKPALASGGGPISTAAPLAGYVPSDLTPKLVDARSDLSDAMRAGCMINFTATEPRTCAYGEAEKPVVVLMGDSHAEVWTSPLQKLAEERGFRLVTLLKTSCPAGTLTVRQLRLNRPFHECDTWRDAALDEIAASRPTLVVATEFKAHDIVGEETHQTRAAGTATTVSRLVDNEVPVLWLADAPEFSREIPNCLSDHLHDPSSCTESRADAVDDGYATIQAAAVKQAGGDWFDVNRWLCPGDVCPVINGRYLMYRDRHHMTAEYAETLAPALGRQIALTGVLLPGTKAPVEQPAPGTPVDPTPSTPATPGGTPTPAPTPTPTPSVPGTGPLPVPIPSPTPTPTLPVPTLPAPTPTAPTDPLDTEGVTDLSSTAPRSVAVE